MQASQSKPEKKTRALKTIKRLVFEYWPACVLALIWALVATAKPKDADLFHSLVAHVNTFGLSFYIFSWITGQYYRAQKNQNDRDSQTKLEERLEALSGQVKSLSNKVEGMHRSPTEQHLLSTNALHIPLSDVKQFYEMIAKRYVDRNTDKYRETYSRAAHLIRAHLVDKSGIRVCDVGGGVGKLVEPLLDLKPDWTNIDISGKSLAIFETEYRELISVKSVEQDVRSIDFSLEKEAFDAVVMCFLLSSLEKYPDLKTVFDSMKADSIFVVADNHESYVKANPVYGAKVLTENGTEIDVYIEPKPQSKLAIRAFVESFGFEEIAYDTVSLNNGSLIYSQMFVFRKAATQTLNSTA